MTDKNKEQISFEIQRIYIKDLSFEAPNTPKIFYNNWTPNLNFSLNTIVHNIKKNIFEIILKIQVVVKIKKDLAFLCDVHQAGVFFILEVDQKKLQQILYVYCPNILFPYARSCISNLVSYASFPQLNLAPINFHAIYENHMKLKKK